MARLLARAVPLEGGAPFVAELEGDTLHEVAGTILDAGARTGRVVPVASARLLSPVEPSKVVGITLNYRAHAAEMGKEPPPEPLYFLKPSTSVIGPGDTVRLPADSADVHHEGELAVVLGRRLSRASDAEAAAAVLGITGCIDVTARDLQRRYANYTRSKCYDTFCPLGPVIACGLSADDLAITLRVNGEVRQQGRTSDMIFGVATLLSAISQVMTLLPGDVVSTGTPPGVGPIVAGDRVELEVEGVGVLSVSVAR